MEKKSAVIFLILFFIPSLFFVPSLLAVDKKEKKEKLEPYAFNKRCLMAVMPFENKTKEEKYDCLGAQIADQLINEIFSYNRYRLIEREKLSALIDELQVQQTDYFKDNFAAKVGSQLGAELMLVGSIIAISEHTEKQSLGIIAKQNTILNLSLEARVVNIATGEILVISKWTGDASSSKKRALMATTGDDKHSEDLIDEAIKKSVSAMAYQLCQDAPQKE